MDEVRPKRKRKPLPSLPPLPIDPRSYTGLLGTPFDPKSVDELQEQFRAKNAALFERFLIDRKDPDAWKRLALALAVSHVPGYYSDQNPILNADNWLNKPLPIKQPQKQDFDVSKRIEQWRLVFVKRYGKNHGAIKAAIHEAMKPKRLTEKEYTALRKDYERWRAYLNAIAGEKPQPHHHCVGECFVETLSGTDGAPSGPVVCKNPLKCPISMDETWDFLGTQTDEHKLDQIQVSQRILEDFRRRVLGCFPQDTSCHDMSDFLIAIAEE